MNIYRGIKVDNNVKLYNKDGSYNNKVKKCLDSLVDKLSGNGHELLSEYIGIQDKVLIDFKCGHNPHLISPSCYKIGRGCPECGNIMAAESLIEKTKQDFILLVNSNGHLLLSEYVGAKEYILIDYQCGHGEKRIVPDAYKRGIRCDECGNFKIGETKIKNAKEKFISLLTSNGHELVQGEYLDSQTKICINFKCGHEPHWITPNSYQQGTRCPICNESKGENRIRNWLEENNIEFIAQNEFDDLVGLGGGHLSYDFYLVKENILIEYQGEQHERFIKGIHETTKNFKKQQEHDKRKREYAISHNISLLEIWYWDFDNIKSILKNFTLKLNNQIV